MFIQLPKQRHRVTEHLIPSKTQPRTARKNLTRTYTSCLNLLTVEHVPPEVHTCSICTTRQRPSASFHVSPRLTSSCIHQHLRHPPTLAHASSWLWLLTTTVNRCLLRWLFDQSQKFSIGLVLLSFSRRFQFWASFLHLRSLNPNFWSFSSLWLNKMNVISYVLSPLCWMVLLAIMHYLRIWLSFSRIVNYGDMWLV